MRQRATRLFSIGANGKAPSGPVPSLDLDFLAMQTTGVLDSRITYTRASPATMFDSTGAMITVASGVPRFAYDPITLQPKGFLIETTATNLLLNSENLSTQNVTVSAVAYMLSFYGTGTITASGAASFTLTGTGAFPNRTQVRFTPTAGTLTLTVTGTVQYAQLETGNVATSWVETAGATATRQGDVANVSGSNFTAIANLAEGTVVAEYEFYGPSFGVAGTSRRIGGVDGNARIVDLSAGPGNTSMFNGTTTIAVAVTTPTNVVQKAAGLYSSGDYRLVLNGSAPATRTDTLLNTANRLPIGNSGNAAQTNGYMRRFRYYPTRLTTAEMQALTT